jgi:hypothetical protein
MNPGWRIVFAARGGYPHTLRVGGRRVPHRGRDHLPPAQLAQRRRGGVHAWLRGVRLGAEPTTPDLVTSAPGRVPRVRKSSRNAVFPSRIRPFLLSPVAACCNGLHDHQSDSYQHRRRHDCLGGASPCRQRQNGVRIDGQRMTHAQANCPQAPGGHLQAPGHTTATCSLTATAANRSPRVLTYLCEQEPTSGTYTKVE